MATISGVPVEYVLMPGESSDIQGLAELPLNLPANSEVALDAAYTEYLWEDFARETDRICLLVQRKSNSKRRDVPALHDYKLWLRRRIETVFGEITRIVSKKDSCDGFCRLFIENQFVFVCLSN
jgi:hypothetical protein